jgi:hypothetical protein
VGASITFTQESFRGRNDDGTEATATWKAALNTNWNQPTETPFRIRFSVSRLSEGTSQNGEHGLYVSHNNGTFQYISSTIGTSPVIDVVSSTLDAQGTDTTQQIGIGTYLTNNNGVNNNNGEAKTTSATWPDSVAYQADIEFCLKIRSSQVAVGDTLEFRGRFNDTIYSGGYTNSPILTVPPKQLLIRGGTLAIKGGTLAIK